MLDIGPPARQQGESVTQYRERRDRERQAIKLHTKGRNLTQHPKVILNSKGRPAAAPYVKPKRPVYHVVPLVPLEKIGQGETG